MTLSSKHTVAAGLSTALVVSGLSLAPVASAASTRTVTADPVLTASANDKYYADGGTYKNLDDLELIQAAAERVLNEAITAPVAAVVLAYQFATGDIAGFHSQLRQAVDAPLYIADPVLELASRHLPAELGGGTDNDPRGRTDGIHNGPGTDGGLQQFRNTTLLDTRDNINKALNGGTLPGNTNYASDIVKGATKALTTGDDSDFKDAVDAVVHPPTTVTTFALPGNPSGSGSGGTGGSDPTGSGGDPVTGHHTWKDKVTKKVEKVKEHRAERQAKVKADVKKVKDAVKKAIHGDDD